MYKQNRVYLNRPNPVFRVCIIVYVYRAHTRILVTVSVTVGEVNNQLLGLPRAR